MAEIKKAFIEDYKGVVGFEAILKGDSKQLAEYITKQSDIYECIKQIGLRLNELGWTPFNAGNISIREFAGHTRFFITAGGSQFSNLKPEEITCVHNIELVVGGISLDLASNYGIYGELHPHSIVNALEEQGLFEKLKRDLNIEDFDYRFPKSNKKEIELIERGWNLLKKLRKEEQSTILDFDAVFTKDRIAPLAEKYNLTDKEIESLYAVCGSKSSYDFYREGIAKQNKKIINKGLDLKTLVTYLGKKGLINCKVHYTGTRKPSSETPLHGLLYAMRWEYDCINAIVHCHAPRITQNPPKDIPITKTDQKIIGYGSLELAVEAWEALQDKMCVLLRGHGPVAVSPEWQRWIPTGRTYCSIKGYTIDPSFSNVFEYAFNILKEKDQSATPKNLISNIKEIVYG